jgi:hypothetical protein
VNPIDVQPPAFVMSPEDKGDKITHPEPYDPEPQEDEFLKNRGATLISKRVQV